MAKKGNNNLPKKYFEGEALRDWVTIAISALSLCAMIYQIHLQKKQTQ